MWLKEDELLLTDLKTVGKDEDVVLLTLRDLKDSYHFYLHLNHEYTSYPQSKSDLIALKQQLAKIPRFAKLEKKYHKISDTEEIALMYGSREEGKYLPLRKFQDPNFSEYARQTLKFPFPIYGFKQLIMQAIKKQDDYGQKFSETRKKLDELVFENINPGQRRRKEFLTNFSKEYDGSDPKQWKNSAATKFCEKIKVLDNIKNELHKSLEESKLTEQLETDLKVLLRQFGDNKSKELRNQLEDLVTIKTKTLPQEYIELLREKLSVGNLLEEGYVKLDFSKNTFDIFLNSMYGVDIRRKATANELAQMPTMAFDIEKEQYKTKDPKITPVCSIFDFNEGYCDVLRDTGAEIMDGVKIILHPDEKTLLEKLTARINEKNPYIHITQNGKGYDHNELAKTELFNIGEMGRLPNNHTSMNGKNSEVFGKEQHDLKLLKRFCILSSGKLETIVPFLEVPFKKIIDYIEEDALEKKAIAGDKQAAYTLAEYCTKDVKNALIEVFKKHRLNEYFFEIGLAYENKVGLAMNNKTQLAIGHEYYRRFKNQKKPHPDYKIDERVEEIMRLFQDNGVTANKKTGIIDGSIIYLPVLEESQLIKQFLQPFEVKKFYEFIEGKDDPLEKLKDYKRKDIHYNVIKPFAEEIWKDRDMVRKAKFLKIKLFDSEFKQFYGFTPGEFDLSIRQSAEGLAAQIRNSGLKIISLYDDLLFMEGTAHFEDKKIVNYKNVRMINGKDFTLALIDNSVVSAYGISYTKRGKSDYEHELLEEMVETILKENNAEKAIMQLHDAYKKISGRQVPLERMAYKIEKKEQPEVSNQEAQQFKTMQELGITDVGQEAYYVRTKSGAKKLEETTQNDIDEEHYLAKIFGEIKANGTRKLEKGSITKILEPVLFYEQLPRRREMLERAIVTGQINPELIDINYEKLNKEYEQLKIKKQRPESMQLDLFN